MSGLLLWAVEGLYHGRPTEEASRMHLNIELQRDGRGWGICPPTLASHLLNVAPGASNPCHFGGGSFIGCEENPQTEVERHRSLWGRGHYSYRGIQKWNLHQ